MLSTNQATNPVEERVVARSKACARLSAGCSTTASWTWRSCATAWPGHCGCENYFELKLRKNERMKPAQLKRILDDSWPEPRLPTRATWRSAGPRMASRRSSPGICASSHPATSASHGRLHAVWLRAPTLVAQLPPPGHS